MKKRVLPPIPFDAAGQSNALAQTHTAKKEGAAP